MLWRRVLSSSPQSATASFCAKKSDIGWQVNKCAVEQAKVQLEHERFEQKLLRMDLARAERARDALADVARYTCRTYRLAYYNDLQYLDEAKYLMPRLRQVCADAQDAHKVSLSKVVKLEKEVAAAKAVEHIHGHAVGELLETERVPLPLGGWRSAVARSMLGSQSAFWPKCRAVVLFCAVVRCILWSLKLCGARAAFLRYTVLQDKARSMLGSPELCGAFWPSVAMRNCPDAGGRRRGMSSARVEGL